LNVLRLQAGKASQDRLGPIAGRKAGKHTTQSDPCSLEDRFSSADLRVTNDALVEMREIPATATDNLISSLVAYLKALARFGPIERLALPR